MQGGREDRVVYGIGRGGGRERDRYEGVYKGPFYRGGDVKSFWQNSSAVQHRGNLRVRG